MALITRVLVVDDSSVVRRLVTTAIESEPGLRVVGTAGDGAAALRLVATTRPDVVVLDLAMPGVDGLQTLLRIDAEYPEVGVVVFSNIDTTSAKNLRAVLDAKAITIVAKPTGVVDVADGVEAIRRLLVSELRKPAAPVHEVARSRTAPVHAVCVAASTGGPHALEAVFGRLRALPVPIFVVQHISADFSGRLAAQLDQVCAASVVEADHGEKPTAGTIYVAPGGAHLTLGRHGTEVTMSCDDDPPVNSCRPSADVLFRSAVEVYGRHQLGVVLTGIGEDGLAGCRAMSARGAPVLVQDEATSVVWGMPGAVAKAGLATEVVGLDAMADRIDRLVTTRSRLRT